MARKVEEWIGKSDDSRIPPRVKLRVLEKYEFRCYLSGVEIRDGDHVEYDHIVALINGGENRESNLAPALRKPHREKTKADLAEKKKVADVRKKAFVRDRPKRRWPKRPFPTRQNPWG